jgi:hypothetical protein
MLPEHTASYKSMGEWNADNSQIGEKFIGKVADTEADCRAKMLIYLVENGLCSVGTGGVV